MTAPEASTRAPRRGQAAALDALGQPARRDLRLAAACNVLAGWLLVPQAAAIAWAIETVFSQRLPVSLATTPLCVLLATGLARAALGWLARSRADAAVETVRTSLRHALARRLSALGPLRLRTRSSGALAELMGTHVDAMDGYFAGYRLARAEALAVPLVLLVAAFWVDPVVGAVLLATLPLIPVFMMLVGWGAEAASRRQLQALARLGGHFADRLRGLGVIRLYGRGEAETEALREAAEGVRSGSMKVLRIAFLSSAVLEFFASLGVAMVAVYLGLSLLGMLDLRSTPLTLGTSVFCLLLAPETYAPLRRLAAHYHDRANALAALGEIEQAFDEASADDEPVEDASMQDAVVTAVHAIAPTRDIVAQRLALRPRGATRAVLRGLDFELGPGQWLALSGPSGCGKSTLLDALAGWLPPDTGTLSMPHGLRIGYALQRPHLFQGTLADNLRLGRADASDAELIAAAEAAQVMRFAHALPQGLDTMLGERGFGLSGGQARRIALARALLGDPQLLLLDEPTAFLDADTEAALLASIVEFARGRTVVMATHSPAALRMATRVLSLDAFATARDEAAA